MSMEKAYCPELRKIVTMIEARKKFSEQSIHKCFHFFCPDPNCVQPGNKGRTQFSGHSHTVPCEEILDKKAHFQLFPSQSHSENCQYWAEIQKATQQVSTTKTKGTVNTDNTKTRYTDKPIQDNHLGDFDLSDDNDDYSVHKNTTSLVVKQSKEVSIQNNTTHKNSTSLGYRETQRKSKKFAKLIKEFLDIQKKKDSGEIDKSTFFKMTLTVNSKEFYVYEFFRLCQNIYNESFNGCCIGSVRYINKEDSIIKFELFRSEQYEKNDKDDKRPIFVYLPESSIKEIDRQRIYSDIDTFIYGKKKFSQKIYFMSFSVKQEKDKIIFFINNSSHLYIKNSIRKNSDKK